MSKSASKRPPNPSVSLVFFSATTGPPCLPNHSNNRREDKQCNVLLMEDGDGVAHYCSSSSPHEHGTAVRRGGNPARHAHAQPEPLSRCLQIGPDTVRPALFYFEVYKSETIEQLPAILAHHGCFVAPEKSSVKREKVAQRSEVSTTSESIFTKSVAYVGPAYTRASNARDCEERKRTTSSRHQRNFLGESGRGLTLGIEVYAILTDDSA
ncbi:hypothetical protein B0H10DRAFT_1963216 [Mycena sp. CBHHK59/15]|nr:hypothetical protein B0H10DRAFT_1963216 [Mycena sp. CBHHK59/15]